MSDTRAPREAGNELVSMLPGPDRAHLLACCERVQLLLGQVLHEPSEPMRDVYFPTASLISLVAVVDHHQGLEVDMIGREGMLGIQVALGARGEPFEALVQGPGPAWRIAVRPFRAELARSAALRRTVGRYIGVLMTRRAMLAGCLRFHEIGPRLARWLLMGQDGAGGGHFHVTHEFMAHLLGVRRVGVTLAAGEFQRRGLIAYSRGDLTVMDRAGLESASCSCYAAQRRAYAVLSFGGLLGLGEKLFAVPWAALKLDTVNERFTLDIPKATLKDAPGFDRKHWPSMSDQTWASGVHRFYGTPYTAQ